MCLAFKIQYVLYYVIFKQIANSASRILNRVTFCKGRCYHRQLTTPEVSESSHFLLFHADFVKIWDL